MPDVFPGEPDALTTPSPMPSTVSLWDGLDPTLQARLDAVTTMVEVAAGEWLFREGDAADAMYVVQRGRLDVVIAERVVRSIGHGEVIGELALLTGEPRSAGVRAARDSVLKCLVEPAFRRTVAQDAALMLHVTRTIASRLRSVQPPQLLNAAPAVVTLVGADDEAPTEIIAHALGRALVEFVSVTVVGDDSADTQAARLAAAEASHERVLLHASSARSQWRDFCLRSADRTVLVVGRRELTASLDAPGERLGECHVVFVDRNPSRAEIMTAHDALSGATLHRVDGATPSSMRPLAARLAGRSLGLALAGGGARALAHIGVLEVFAEAGIEFDRIAGTSMGAIVAAAWATGRDPAGIYTSIYEEFVRRNPLRDYTVPRHGLIRGRRAHAAFERQFGDVLIEELPREFSCVSVDLLAKQPFVHRRGRLVDALLASNRLPGIFAPVRMHGSLHVDGTVLQNLPVDAFARPSDGPIIAIDIGSGSAASRAANGRPPRMPALSETLLRTTLMGSAAPARVARARAELVIAPDVAAIGMFSWREIDAARDAGRRAATDALPAVQSLLRAPPGARRSAPLRSDTN